MNVAMISFVNTIVFCACACLMSILFSRRASIESVARRNAAGCQRSGDTNRQLYEFRTTIGDARRRRSVARRVGHVVVAENCVYDQS
jgi:hypothetical protein